MLINYKEGKCCRNCGYCVGDHGWLICHLSEYEGHLLIKDDDYESGNVSTVSICDFWISYSDWDNKYLWLDDKIFEYLLHL